MVSIYIAYLPGTRQTDLRRLDLFKMVHFARAHADSCRNSAYINLKFERELYRSELDQRLNLKAQIFPERKIICRNHGAG